MIKLFQNNLDLYHPSKEKFLKSLEIAKSLQNNTTDGKIIFHCLWRVPKDLNIKHVTVLKSIITSHSDHIENLEINFWSNVNLSDNPLLKDVKRFINFRLWNYDTEKSGTILSTIPHLNNYTISDPRCYLEGDIFRLLILHKYGGFYIDMDVLVLRDMSPLNNLEFQYQWGTSGFFDEPLSINGAIMRLECNSPLSLEFLELISKTQGFQNSTSWGNQMYSRITKNDLLVLPGVWFNSDWGFGGSDNIPFKKRNDINLFDGAFTWHWHNKWDDYIEEGSKFWILMNIIESRFSELLIKL